MPDIKEDEIKIEIDEIEIEIEEDIDSCNSMSESEMFETPIYQWSNLNFEDMMDYRIHKKKSSKTFDSDIKLWCIAIKSLEPYNEVKIKDEINSMDFSFPSDENDLNILKEAYSRFSAYRFRIGKLIFDVNSHYEIFDQAYKSLKTEAAAIGTGTIKDKEATAESIALPFLIASIPAKNLLVYLKDVASTIEYAAMNLSRILREKESQMKFHYPYVSEGNISSFEKMTNDEIPVRNKKRLE